MVWSIIAYRHRTIAYIDMFSALKELKSKIEERKKTQVKFHNMRFK